MKVIRAHKCLCQDCDPAYHENLQVSTMEEAQAAYEVGVSEERRID